MATRKKKAYPVKQPDYKTEICDNCMLAKWVTHLHQHLDKFGKPICLTCPNEQYFIVRGQNACSHFVRRKTIN